MTERQEAYLLRGEIQIDDAYLGGYCFRFIRRFSMVAMIGRIANADFRCMPCSGLDLRVAEAYE